MQLVCYAIKHLPLHSTSSCADITVTYTYIEGSLRTTMDRNRLCLTILQYPCKMKYLNLQCCMTACHCDHFCAVVQLLYSRRMLVDINVYNGTVHFNIYTTLKQSLFFLFIQFSMAVNCPISQKQKIHLYFRCSL